MKNLVFMLILGACLCGTARADLDNRIGVYFDQDGEIPCTENMGFLTCYVVATNLADPVGLAGWQFELAVDGSNLILSGSCAVPGINMDTSPRYLFGCAQVMPASDAMVLVELYLYALQPGSIQIRHLSESFPVACLHASSMTVVRHYPAYGTFDTCVASFGGADCPEPATGLGAVRLGGYTLGSLKALYR